MNIRLIGWAMLGSAGLSQLAISVFVGFEINRVVGTFALLLAAWLVLYLINRRMT